MAHALKQAQIYLAFSVLFFMSACLSSVSSDVGVAHPHPRPAQLSRGQLSRGHPSRAIPAQLSPAMTSHPRKPKMSNKFKEHSLSADGSVMR